MGNVCDFKDLRVGDKFSITDSSPWPLVGVVVTAPVLVKTVKRLFRKPVFIYRAKAIELHQYLGAVEWNPEYPSDTDVEILA